MHLTAILWFEIGVAVLMGVGILWTKPEYSLFVYAFALGFPDVALPLGTAINIRIDDALVLVFFVRSLLWVPAPFSLRQRKIFAWQALFLALCLVSAAVGAARGAPPEAYETAKMAGCAAILLVLPRLIQSERRLRFLIAGLMCGGCALVIQVAERLGTNPANAFANFQELKNAATFSTWNPNTIGQAAMLLAFSAGLGGILFPRTRRNRFLWASLATGFAVVPLLVFVRGTSLSIAAGFILFLCMVRRWRWALLFAAACLCVVLYLHSVDRQLVEEATDVNLETGEGFSHRFDRWDMALRAIRTNALLGQGFGQEWNYLRLVGSEGRAHNAYLTVWLELGLGGLVLFVAAISQFIRAGLFLYRSSRFQPQGALILALTVALALDSLGLPTLYWEKLPTIALCIVVVVVGLCERSDSAVAEREIRAFARSPFTQLS